MSLYEGSIDDNDPQIIYSDGWELVTSDGNWHGTMHSTSTIVSSARVRFTGTRIAFICTIPTGDGQLSQASFVVDGGAPVRIAHATTPPVQWQTTFWDSGPLPYGSHLVTMTNTGNDAYLRLDRIDYDPTTGNAPSSRAAVPQTKTVVGGTATVQSTVTSVVVVSESSGAVSSSSSVTSTGGQSLQTGTVAVPTNSNTSPEPSSSAGAKLNDSDTGSSPDAQKSSSATPPVAAIVGCVLGALLAIALIALVLLFYRRKKSQRAMSAYLDESAIHGGGGTGAQGLVGSRWRGVKRTMPTPFSIARGSTSNLAPQSNTEPSLDTSPTGESSNISLTSLSSPFNYYDSSRGVVSASASVYHHASESSSQAHGSYGSYMYQYNGAAGAGSSVGGQITGGSSSKHAEFVAEQQHQYNQRQQQQQQMQQIDPRAVVFGRAGTLSNRALPLPPPPSQSQLQSQSHHQHYEESDAGGAPSSVGPFMDEVPPPAYPGCVVHNLNNQGGGGATQMSGSG
ncbi:hypothetical protein JR316_0002502 [Psilocybe cubensis]|nr:hypothetical protein JR316_0002502 [Psilocybe cubensis]KAH9485592.1 hypothetical protein JR316_0002502 [Psilocybe cubensis]